MRDLKLIMNKSRFESCQKNMNIPFQSALKSETKSLFSNTKKVKGEVTLRNVGSSFLEFSLPPLSVSPLFYGYLKL